MTATDAAAAPDTRVLASSAQEVGGALRTAVSQLPTPLSLAAGFHLGWNNFGGERIFAKQGKMVRPAFVLAAARAVNSGELNRSAILAGVAVELVHNFSLVHDDVMDADELRRGRPTVWVKFGVPFAILLGDALLALASQVLTQDGSGEAATMCAELNDVAIALCVGQHHDMMFEQRLTVSTDEYLAMVSGKTGALLAGACALGALAGGAEIDQLSALRRFGHHVGLAFQLVDDILGIWGDPSVTGKPSGTDLLRYKKTMPVLLAMNTETAAGDELADIYERRLITGNGGLEHAVRLVERAGGRERTEAEASGYLTSALQCLDELDCDPQALNDLRALALMMINRTR